MLPAPKSGYEGILVRFALQQLRPVLLARVAYVPEIMTVGVDHPLCELGVEPPFAVEFAGNDSMRKVPE